MSDNKVSYINKEAENHVVKPLKFEDLAGKARSSFRKSLENAVLERTKRVSDKLLVGNSKEFVTEYFIILGRKTPKSLA